MKFFAFVLGFIFITFLLTPTVISLIDRNVDISIAYNVNEEESSSKNQISLEYRLEEIVSNYESIHFLQIRKINGHYYKENGYKVFLSISLPPPKLA
tara:strand:- start:579 stop:869 length:291 start_codon:yes stop_codon:yes gene_type:complete